MFALELELCLLIKSDKDRAKPGEQQYEWSGAQIKKPAESPPALSLLCYSI